MPKHAHKSTFAKRLRAQHRLTITSICIYYSSRFLLGLAWTFLLIHFHAPSSSQFQAPSVLQTCARKLVVWFRNPVSLNLSAHYCGHRSSRRSNTVTAITFETNTYYLSLELCLQKGCIQSTQHKFLRCVDFKILGYFTCTPNSETLPNGRRIHINSQYYRGKLVTNQILCFHFGVVFILLRNSSYTFSFK